MTYSLVALDPDGSTLGAVTASRYLAVGATVPGVAPGAGALVTQAHTNTRFRAEGLGLLAGGASAGEVVEALVSADPGRDRRQLAVVDAVGGAAAWTGPACSGAAGHLLREGYAVAGNLLADRTVLGAMADTFAAATGSLAERLLLALAAGEEAGGDRRGRQSAALLVLGAEDPGVLRTPARVDLRVDDAGDPVGELRRLLELHRLVVEGPDEGSAVALTGEVAAEVDVLLRAAGFGGADLAERLRGWAHRENLEHRLLAEQIDVEVLQELRVRSGALRAAGDPRQA